MAKIAPPRTGCTSASPGSSSKPQSSSGSESTEKAAWRPGAAVRRGGHVLRRRRSRPMKKSTRAGACAPCRSAVVVTDPWSGRPRRAGEEGMMAEHFEYVSHGVPGKLRACYGATEGPRSPRRWTTSWPPSLAECTAPCVAPWQGARSRSIGASLSTDRDGSTLRTAPSSSRCRRVARRGVRDPTRCAELQRSHRRTREGRR